MAVDPLIFVNIARQSLATCEVIHTERNYLADPPAATSNSPSDNGWHADPPREGYLGNHTTESKREFPLQRSHVTLGSFSDLGAQSRGPLYPDEPTSSA